MPKKIWLNHKLVREPQANVSVFDRGFLYGDGVYEAVRVYQGKIFREAQHWRRLEQSLRSIQMKVSWKPKELSRACQNVIRANRLREALLRITISRGRGEPGYDPRTSKKPTLVIFDQPIRKDLEKNWRQGVKISVVDIRRNPIKSLNPAIKHTNSLNGILAKIQSLKTGAFEGVFQNLYGYLSEGTISNLFIIKNNILKTPSLESGILSGVTRAAVLECAKRAGMPYQETLLPPDQLFQADEVFLSSTTMEVMPVVQVDHTRIGDGRPGPITKILQSSLKKLIIRELNLPNGKN